MDQIGQGYIGVGATLRSARERAGLEAEQVAKALRMQAAQLTAIEQGRFDELPGQVYALGFLRSYAEYLGFDGDAAVRRLKEELSGEPARPSPLTFPVPVGEARTPGPRLLLFAVIAAAAIYGAWVYWGRGQTGMVELVPPLPERLAKLIGETPTPAIAAPSQPTPAVRPTGESTTATAAAPAPVAAAPRPAATPPVTAPAATPAPAPVTPLAPAAPAAQPLPPEMAPAPATTATAAPPAAVPTAAPTPPLVAAAPVGAEVVPPPPPRPAPPVETPTSSPQVAAALPVPPSFPTVPAEGAAPALQALPAAAATGNVYGVPAADSRVTLRAKSISWVQVRGGDNEILITRTLRAGDTYHLPNRTDLVMMTGSAGGLEVLVDGKPVPPLGAAGEVRRNIPLDPEKLVKLGH